MSISQSDDSFERRIEALGRDFNIAFFQGEVTRHPENIEAWILLGEDLTRAGRYEDGMRVDEHLVRLRPEHPTFHYNLACSLALLGCEERALSSLEHAIDLGYRDDEFMEGDEDLAAIRSNPRFNKLLRRIREDTADGMSSI